MIWVMLSLGYLVVGIVIGAAFPSAIKLLTSKQGWLDNERLGLIVLLWPLPFAYVLLVVLLRTCGFVARHLPVLLGRVARWVRAQTELLPEPKENTDAAELRSE